MKGKCLLAAVFVLLLLAASCGGNSPMNPPPVASCTPSSKPEFAYVLNFPDNSVSMYTVDSCNGSLTPTTPATVATGSSPTQPAPEQMVADPSGRFAYVANQSGASVAAFNIAANGALSIINSSRKGALVLGSPPSSASAQTSVAGCVGTH